MDYAEILKATVLIEAPFFALIVWLHRQAITRLDRSHNTQVEGNQAIKEILARHDEKFHYHDKIMEKAHERIDEIKRDIYKHHGSS